MLSGLHARPSKEASEVDAGHRLREDVDGKKERKGRVEEGSFESNLTLPRSSTMQSRPHCLNRPPIQSLDTKQTGKRE